MQKNLQSAELRGLELGIYRELNLIRQWFENLTLQLNRKFLM